VAFDDNAVVHGHGRRQDIQNMHDCESGCRLLVEDRNRFLPQFKKIQTFQTNFAALKLLSQKRKMCFLCPCLASVAFALKR
jgi:hypothetical protein